MSIMKNKHDDTDTDELDEPQPAGEAQERIIHLLNEALDRDLVLLFEEDLAA